MKRFVEVNGKEAVIVQGYDLRFIDSHAGTSQDIRNLITLEHIDVSKQEKEFIFYENQFVHYMKTATFILDKDEFSKMSYEEICKEFSQTNNKMEKLLNAVNKDLEKKEVFTKKRHNKIAKLKNAVNNDEELKEDITKKQHELKELFHYSQSISYFLDHEKRKGKVQ